MVYTFHTRVSVLNRDKHTLQYTWQTILWRCATTSNFIKYIFYSTRKWKTTRTENYFMEFHSRHPNSHGFVGVSCEYTTIDSHYPQPLCTILYYNGTHYNGTLRCIACVRSYAEHCFVQWPVACYVYYSTQQHPGRNGVYLYTPIKHKTFVYFLLCLSYAFVVKLDPKPFWWHLQHKTQFGSFVTCMLCFGNGP